MGRLRTFFTNRYTLAYAAALMLHLLFFLLYAPLQSYLALPAEAHRVRPDPQPMSFEFVDSPKQPSAEKPPEKTPFVSDRNAVSRDEATDPLPRSAVPFSKGQVATRDLRPTTPGVEATKGTDGEGKRQVKGAEARGGEEFTPSDQGTNFTRLLKEGKLQNRQERQEAMYGHPAVPPSFQMDNPESRALGQGGLQLSTYAWDYAPYLAYLKRLIESNIFPPPAFSQYGMIHGKTLVRFKIFRDGSMKDLEVLKSDGSPLLRDTSVRAVNMSSPFRPLPKDFPNAYLEITGQFNYILMRNAQQEP